MQDVTLLYPKSDIENLTYKADKNVTVNIRFVDLTDENPLSSITDGKKLIM